MNYLPNSVSLSSRLFFIFWNRIPPILKKFLMRVYTQFYDTTWSRFIIPYYCKRHYKDPAYLNKFIPSSGAESYQSFQDFFARRFKTSPEIASPTIWPCEGILCEQGQVANLPEVNIKGEKRALRTIFGANGSSIPDNYYFSNIFLHNMHYHRIHAPVSGTITRIEHIPGDLQILRPWFYQQDPSYPALTNERVNVDLLTTEGKHWHLSIVGGPAVGSIVMAPGIEIGAEVPVGGEIATFLLGSTCCIASPVSPDQSKLGKLVEVGIAF